jgi:hypothetical protein
VEGGFNFNQQSQVMDFSLIPNLEDSERIAKTMKVISYEEAKAGVTRYIVDPLEEQGELNDWDLKFQEFVEEHKDRRLLSCRYGRTVGLLISPADHRGIWVMIRENITGKGVVPDHIVSFLEGLAKQKGLL